MIGRRARHLLLAGATVLALPAWGTTARADDLRSALLSAYQTNPSLLAARETQKATDEGVPLARADGLPSLSAAAEETEFVKQNPLAQFQQNLPRQLTVTGTAGVPIYSGGAVRNAVNAAKTRVSAGKQDLRSTEANVFAQTVAAYMDVILNEAVVRLNQAQVQTLEVNLRATSDRFQIGDVTRTDVAQSQSRLALARGNLRTAQADLASARERYIQVVGKAPGELQAPPPLPGLPATVEDALHVALETNPDLIAARQRSRAARYDTSAARASRLPRVSLFADAGYVDFLGSLSVPGLPSNLIPQSAKTADVGVRATIPLYQGGRPSAQVRQAQAHEGAALEQEIGAERQVVAGVRTDYSQWLAANEIIASNQTAVDAASLSLEGVRAENSVGNRTILDILNAEQELVNAQLQLVTAKRNAYVAGFTLLAAMGRAGARELGLDGGALYDPDLHYRQAKGVFWDWSDGPKPSAHSTRTVDTPAQGGSLSDK